MIVDLDDLDELVDPAVPGEDWLTQHQLRENASSRPAKKHYIIKRVSIYGRTEVFADLLYT